MDAKPARQTREQTDLARGVVNSYHPEDVREANKTYRYNGAIGRRAITPRYVRDTVAGCERILDYGAGTHAIHAAELRAMGLNVTAHEFGANQVPGVHEPGALERVYDVVYASNVLNVQPSMDALLRTLREIRHATMPGGRAIMNYPAQPRKLHLSASAMQALIWREFRAYPMEVGGTHRAPLWEVRH